MDGLGLEAGLEAARIKVVILDRVAWTQDMRLLAALHRVYEGKLDIEGQRGRDAVGIDLRCPEALRFEEDEVALALGEAHDFVFD